MGSLICIYRPVQVLNHTYPWGDDASRHGSFPRSLIYIYCPMQVLNHPRQSVGKGCKKSICLWALWLSEVETVFKHGFAAICPLLHSGVDTDAEGGEVIDGSPLEPIIHNIRVELH